MLKIVKFLKPFTVLLLIALVLLYVQAMGELALPDYMSDIVNYGIQQSGIDNAIPNVITKEDMGNLLVFSSDEEKQIILANYELIDSSSSEYETFKDIYTNLKDEPIYILKKINKDDKAQFETLMAEKVLSVEGVRKVLVGEIPLDSSMGEFTIPKGMDITTFLHILPKTKIKEIADKVNAKFTVLGDKMVIQASTAVLAQKYEQLGMDIKVTQRNYILKIGGIMILVTLLVALCTIAVGLISSKIASGMGRNLRSELFTKIENFSNAEIDKFSTASLITRTTNDVTQIENLMVMVIRMMFYAPIIGIGGVIRALDKSTSMSWIIALSVIVLLGFIGVMFVIAVPKFKILQKLVDKINMVTRESLTGIMVVRAFNTQKFEEQRFDDANTKLTSTSLFVNRVMAFLMPAMMLIMNGVTLLIVWVGAHQIAESTMLVGDMMAFMQYALQIIFSFVMLAMMFIMVPRAAVSAQRISEVIETDLSINDPIEPKTFGKELKGNIEFKNVSFKFPGAEEAILKNLSFNIEAGKTTAIIGATGSGKTTLVNLIPRFYDVTEGEILIDGINIKDVTQHNLRDIIGYIPQKAALFSGTIESNLKYANENATKEEIDKAIDIAQAREIINEKEKKLQTRIAQGGKNVSGGQKQRLSIARALVKKPQIYLFDDSFSALDFKTDSNLRKALKKELGHSTVLIVAQRISTIKTADQILVIEDGRIVCMGTHNQLISSCDTYKEIAYSQLSKEELA